MTNAEANTFALFVGWTFILLGSATALSFVTYVCFENYWRGRVKLILGGIKSIAHLKSMAKVIKATVVESGEEPTVDEVIALNLIRNEIRRRKKIVCESFANREADDGK